MIEGQLIQLDNVRVAALVIGMTAPTELFSDLVFFAVKSAAFIDVLFYLFMAVETQNGLAVFVETVMALRAFVLDLGVPLDQFAGHHQGFDGCGLKRE